MTMDAKRVSDSVNHLPIQAASYIVLCMAILLADMPIANANLLVWAGHKVL